MSDPTQTQPELLLSDMLQDVRQFMEGYDQSIRPHATFRVPPEELFLRIHLIREEFEELIEAINVECSTTGFAAVKPHVEPVEALDALTDLLYVILGTYHTLGLSAYAENAWRIVHRSNMSKFDRNGKAIKNADGKVLKGPDYTPPNLTKLFVE